MNKLTGNTRFRIKTRLFRSPLVILQHQVSGIRYDDSIHTTWWVDSKPEWVMNNKFPTYQPLIFEGKR